VVIDFGMKMPSGFTGEVPEFYFVVVVVVEKKVGRGVQWQRIHPDQSDVRGREPFSQKREFVVTVIQSTSREAI